MPVPNQTDLRFPLTRDKLLSYILTLPVALRGVFAVADQFHKEAADTLDEDFQIAAEILDIFKKYAKRRLEGE
jgi:hypothetical protein